MHLGVRIALLGALALCAMELCVLHAEHVGPGAGDLMLLACQAHRRRAPGRQGAAQVAGGSQLVHLTGYQLR
jgi:hypothetical protein